MKGWARGGFQFVGNGRRVTPGLRSSRKAPRYAGGLVHGSAVCSSALVSGAETRNKADGGANFKFAGREKVQQFAAGAVRCGARARKGRRGEKFVWPAGTGWARDGGDGLLEEAAAGAQLSKMRSASPGAKGDGQGK